MLPIVYLYPCRWDMLPGRHRYLMEAMSAHTHVVFLNSPVFRSRLDIRRPRAEQISPTLTVVHDALGFRYSRLGRRMQRVAANIDGRWLRELLAEIGITDYIFWLSANMPEALWNLRTDRMIFDCIDPCFDPKDQAEFDKMEFALARQSKLVFCSAESLVDRLKPINANCHLLPNACSPAEYSADLLRDLDPPDFLKGAARPIIGYMGTFDWRVDTDILAEAARRLPDYTFALAGRVNPDQQQRVAPLRTLRNVIMPGAVSLEDGRKLTAASDVGLIPFLPCEMGDGVNPVKMWMYLAAGKPVVATDTRECRRHAPYVAAAKNADEFTKAIVDAVEGRCPTTAEQRTAFALKNTWQDRAREAAAIIETSLEPRLAKSA